MEVNVKYYSVPADFNKETIDKYEALNNKYTDSRVVETYGNITQGEGNFLASGRLVRQMFKKDWLDLYEYITYSKERNIDFNYTINAPFLHNREFTEKGVSGIKDFLDRLYEAGVRSLTITLPSLMELVQSTHLDFKIRASCICQIANVNKAMFYKSLGVNDIVVNESINRDFHTLKNIREAFGEKVEIIANQICDLNCIYRMFHYNMISGEPEGTVNDVSVNFYEHRCVLQQFKDKSNLLKLSWIRPEDIKYYTDIGIHYFKLQGRHTFIKGGDPVRTVECYFRQHHDGNLMDLLNMFSELTSFSVYVDNKKLDGFLEPFYKIKNFCNFNCTTCDYCETFARKAIDYKKAEETIHSARDFYNEYDPFKNILRSTNKVKEEVRQDEDLEIDFQMD
jgi:collagenase-like PrtC family protease